MGLPWPRYFTKCKLIIKFEEEVFDFLRFLCLTCIVAFKVDKLRVDSLKQKKKYAFVLLFWG